MRIATATCGSVHRAASREGTRPADSAQLHGPKPPGCSNQFIHEDTNGLLWLATETGLLRFDPKTESVFRATQPARVCPTTWSSAFSAITSGNLWLSTNNGISRFNPRDNTFVNYHESDGLQGEQFNRKACSMDPSGIMYFGGLHGFNMFDPQPYSSQTPGCGRVVMTEFRIHGNNVPVQAGLGASEAHMGDGSLHLSHEDEEFSIEFAALKLQRSGKDTLSLQT